MDNSKEPISRHCICDSHLCNFFDLLKKNGEDKLSEKNVIAGQSHDHNENSEYDHSKYTQNGAFPYISFTHSLFSLIFVTFLLT
jgi:hypothetical protein